MDSRDRSTAELLLMLKHQPAPITNNGDSTPPNLYTRYPGAAPSAVHNRPSTTDFLSRKRKLCETTRSMLPSSSSRSPAATALWPVQQVGAVMTSLQLKSTGNNVVPMPQPKNSSNSLFKRRRPTAKAINLLFSKYITTAFDPKKMTSPSHPIKPHKKKLMNLSPKKFVYPSVSPSSPEPSRCGKNSSMRRQSSNSSLHGPTSRMRLNSHSPPSNRSDVAHDTQRSLSESISHYSFSTKH